MRRRRRSAGTWLPTIGNPVGGETTSNDVTGIDGDLDVEDNGVLSTRVWEITLDQPQEDQPSSTPLASVIGSEYFLKRIVGKAFITLDSPVAEPSLVPRVLVGAGFFVSRAEATEPNFPIGAATGTDAEVGRDYSPLETRTQREPWIWRRTWILECRFDIRTQNHEEVPQFPRSTWQYGSVADGPHIDAKTKRRIGNDDRLWFAISACRWPLFATSEEPSGPPRPITYHIDYRLFGSLRKARNRGVF